MATCAELEQQAQQKANDLTSLAAEGNKASAYNIVSADLAERFGSDAARVLIRINQTLADLERIKSQQESGSCTVTGYRPQINAAKAALNNLNAFIDKMDVIVNKAKEEKAASQKATESQNNAGTGTPGTAGTGPGASANDLQEVGVTGKKTPTPVAGSDGLEEVQITSKKTGDGLEEVSVTGKRNPDALTEVQVTGKTNLTEVEVTAKRPNTNSGVAPAVKRTQSQAALQDTTNFGDIKDWRVRLALSPGSNYLYNSSDPGILGPLKTTSGVIFPYTPSISVNYAATYGQVNPVHSNYKIVQYENSSVDSISISCDFTAQDTFEANYLLAVIHFFRSATKMFYGQDQNPKPGTPPPLCYLFGLGQFQFNAHPLVITSFGYNLPADVDYIRAGDPGSANGAPSMKAPQKSKTLGQGLQDKFEKMLSQGIAKIGNSIGLKLTPGGNLSGPRFQEGFNYYNAVGTKEPTYVPTKINLSISCMPVVSRYEISNNFSVKDYANGKLLQGTKRKGGGFW